MRETGGREKPGERELDEDYREPRPRGSLIRGIHIIKYKNVDNTKKHVFFCHNYYFILLYL